LKFAGYPNHPISINCDHILLPNGKILNLTTMLCGRSAHTAWVELIRKDKEKFRSSRKIPPSGKQAL
jgi:hypothetical protein